jgi:hypothetical protein
LKISGKHDIEFNLDRFQPDASLRLYLKFSSFALTVPSALPYSI